MTTFDFLRLALRRWYVVLVGAVLSAALLLGFAHQPPVYTTRVTLVVLPPRTDGPNALRAPAPVVVAAIAAIQVNHRPNVLDASTMDATLLGEGVYNGVSVHVRNEGSQWVPWTIHPDIDVDATGPSAAVVQAHVTQAAHRVRRALTQIQASLHVRPSQRVVITETPRTPAIASAPPSRARVLGGTAAFMFGVTFWALIVTDRVLSRVGRRRRTRAVTATSARSGPSSALT